MRKYLFLALSCFLATHAACRSDEAQPVQDKKGDLVRQRDLLMYRNYFRQLGLAYQTICTEQGKAPRNKDDLARQLEGGRKIIEMLEKGDIVFYYGVTPQQMPKGAGKTILAHESYEDRNGKRLVLLGDGSFREMDHEEFMTAPKAKN